MSSSSSAGLGDCEPFGYDTYGRQGIGVAQPQSGIDYPLVRPSEDVRYLLADFWLTYDDPYDYAAASQPFKPPFRIVRLTGLGCLPGSSGSLAHGSSHSGSSEGSSQSHAADICVVDANSRIVFDSTDLDVSHYADRAWGDRLHIYEWRKDEDAVCFLVAHTKWNPTDDIVPRNYPYLLEPTSAVIDERAVMRLPKRVRSITVVLDRFTKKAVDFTGGYNMDIIAADAVSIDGGKRITNITWDGAPGNGLGIFPGCDPEPLVIRRINGVGPTTGGDFFISALECYWQRAPTTIVSESPRLSIPNISVAPGNEVELGLPDDAAGTAKNLPGWPTDDDPAYAHLQIGNDCGPCCDCPDYVEVAEYLNRQRARYHALGVTFEGIRDQYHENRTRWLEALECFHRRPLRLFLQPQICPFLDVVAQFCNQTDECLTDVELAIDFTTTGGEAGTPLPGFTFLTGARRKPGRKSAQTDRYDLGGSWPSFTAYFESIEASASAHVQFRLDFEGCGLLSQSSLPSMPSLGQPGDVPINVEALLTATAGGMPVQVTDVDSDELVDASVTEAATLDCPPPEGAVYNALKCVQCE